MKNITNMSGVTGPVRHSSTCPTKLAEQSRKSDGVKAKTGNKLSEVKLNYIRTYLHGDQLLDVGAGQCYYSSWIKKCYPHCAVYAIDHRLVAPQEDITFIQADLEKTIAIENEQFQTILAFDIIEHVANEEQLVSELYRLCKKDGILIGSVPHDDDKFLPAYNLTFYHRSDLTHKRYYIPETLQASLERAGFTVMRIDKQGGVSPQVIAEFFPPSLRFMVKKTVGLLRRAKIVNSCVLSSDLFFVAKKA